MAAILIVEGDVPDPALHDLLTAAGHTVRTAAGGAAGVTAVRKAPPAVIVADLMMRPMNGIELAKAVRGMSPGMPVIVLTDGGSGELAVDALRAGAANFLPRRNAGRDLLPMLNELLAVSHSQHKRAVFVQRMTAVEYHFELENDPDLVTNLVSQVELVMLQMDLFDSADQMQVGVAVHEAAVNAMVHGNLEVSSSLKADDWSGYHRAVAERARQSPYKERRVRVAVGAERRKVLRVRIADEGPGFDVSKLPDPTDPENLANGSGRGLLLIRTFFDRVVYNSKGNEVEMIKRAN